jgi:outer membrane protein assembly factor BamB
MDGKELWQRPLGPFNNVNGHGSSPMLAGNLVIMLCDQDTDSYLLAIDKKTGKTAWRVERPEVTRCYSTPGLYQGPGGVTELIIPGAYYLTSYDARTGRKLWWVRGFSWQPKSAVAISDGLIYAHGWEGGGEAETVPDTPTWEETKKRFDKDGDGKVSAAEFAPDERLARGMVNNDLNSDGFMDEREWENFRARRASRNSIMVVKPGGTGDVTKTHVLWQMQKFVPNVPSPLVYERILYLVKDGGILSALDGPTGKMLKQGRLAGALDTYYSSPVAGDGKVYLLSQPGKSTIIRAGAEWEVIHQADMEEECYATPALVDGKIYLRTRGSLYCFGKA